MIYLQIELKLNPTRRLKASHAESLIVSTHVSIYNITFFMFHFCHNNIELADRRKPKMCETGCFYINSHFDKLMVTSYRKVYDFKYSVFI